MLWRINFTDGKSDSRVWINRSFDVCAFNSRLSLICKLGWMRSDVEKNDVIKLVTSLKLSIHTFGMMHVKFLCQKAIMENPNQWRRIVLFESVRLRSIIIKRKWRPWTSSWLMESSCFSEMSHNPSIWAPLFLLRLSIKTYFVVSLQLRRQFQILYEMK